MITDAAHALLVRHYTLVAPMLVRQFGAIPFAWVSYPFGLEKKGVYHRDPGVVPSTIPTVNVTTSSGEHPYVALAENALLWLVHGKFAVEFLSWTPQATALERPLFGHITVEPSPSSTMDDVRAAARVVRAVLLEDGRDAVCELDGVRGLTLWIDARGAATYDDLAPWLLGIAARAVSRAPELVTTAFLRAERGGRVYLGTKSNHPGNGVALPYAVRGTPGFGIAWPVAWERLDEIDNGDVRAENAAEAFARDGDVFASLVAALPETKAISPVDAAAVRLSVIVPVPGDDDTDAGVPQGREYLITAALQILADGRTATAQEIRDAGVAAGLIPASTQAKYVYAALHEYIIRTLGSGRTPPFVQIEHTEQFRLNQPADPWPPIALPERPRRLSASVVQELRSRLADTSVGTDPTAFEVAVCDALRALGFVANHIGGGGKPDGVLTAPLGPRGWRATVECKTASAGGVVANPRPEEPAKFRAAYDATYSLLVGPAFSSDASFLDELRVHEVSLWTVEDLTLALNEELTPAELAAALQPGPVASALATIVWERLHGERKHIAVVASMMAKLGWQTQVRLAQTAGSESPALTDDVLLVLVDQALAEIDPTLLVTRPLLQAAIGKLVAEGIAERSADGGSLIVVVPC